MLLCWQHLPIWLQPQAPRNSRPPSCDRVFVLPGTQAWTLPYPLSFSWRPTNLARPVDQVPRCAETRSHSLDLQPISIQVESATSAAEVQKIQRHNYRCWSEAFCHWNVGSLWWFVTPFYQNRTSNCCDNSWATFDGWAMKYSALHSGNITSRTVINYDVADSFCRCCLHIY